MKKAILFSVALASVLFAGQIEVFTGGNIRALPTTKSETTGEVSVGQKLEYETLEYGWYKLKSGGYIPETLTKAKKANSKKIENIQDEQSSVATATAPAPQTPQNNLQVVEDSAGYRFVDISKSDISRIYCEASDIKSVIFSKEKEIEIEQAGQNIFVKILRKIITTGEETKVQISDQPREVFLECGEKMHSLVMVPKDIPSQTIILKSSYSPLTETAKNTERSSDYESILSGLIKDAYKEKIPAGYTVIPHNTLFYDFKELRLSKVKSYVGHEYEVTEYALSAKNDISLEEKIFLTYLQEPLAVSFEKLFVKKGETLRMFVVSKAKKSTTSP